MDGATERWERIQSVLEQALELEAGEVDGFLDRACAGDEGLRAEVESLIAADRAAPAFLDARALELHAASPAVGPRSLEGTRLGAFRVLAEIGRGGMSVVYAGERVDRQFEQHVAIKVLQRDASAAGMAERFATERRILGSLDHRGIVRILDGGVTEGGRPYLVMDRIEGKRIDEWCDARRLTITGRLRLFLQVLDAVAYAHRALVVHRDLKPANILVSDAGEVKLLDFGIAKLVDTDGAGVPAATRTGLRAMTPEYAAPEQVRGDPITTACDTWALGVLLYELLAGRRPYAIAATTPYAVERAILETEPARPSEAVRTGTGAAALAAARGTEPLRLRGALDGDLDAIVLKALRKEPEQRYGSADAFADDIRRHLDSLPVLARRGSRAYRVRKFLRRHRTGAAVTAGVLLLVFGSTAAIAASRVNAERARIRAEREARTAREVTDFLVDVFAGSDPYVTMGDTVRAHTLLERGRERIDRELLHEPMVRASLLEALGRVYAGLGRVETADSLLQGAVDLRAATLGPDDPGVADALHTLGHSRSVWRDHAGALDALERAHAIWRMQPGVPDSVRAGLLGSLSISLRELGFPDSSRILIDRALAIDRARADSTSVSHLVRRIELGAVLRATGDFEAATRLYEDLRPRLRTVLGDDDPRYSVVINNEAYLLTRQGRWAEAVPLYREALDISRAILGTDHPRVLSFLGNLASALFESGSHDEALAVLRQRHAATERMFPEGHWRVGSGHQGLGKLLLRIGRHAEAEAAFRDAVASFSATLGGGHVWTRVAETWTVLAMTLRGDARGPDLLDRALARLDGAPFDNDTRDDIRRIADHVEGAGDAARAARFRALIAGDG